LLPALDGRIYDDAPQQNANPLASATSMVILRATQKLAATLPTTTLGGETSDTALGDWFVNRFVIDRRPLLLLLSEKSLLPILTPARNVSDLPEALPELVTRRLRRLGVDPAAIDRERTAMSPVMTGRTNSRSVMGFMVDFAKVIPYYLEAGAWDDSTLPFVEAKLAETPCHAGKRLSEVIWPARAAASLLGSSRGAG
jgi:hypothetical protein